jgi:hypothetical protein
VLLGIQAGGSLTTGSDNVFIGHDPGVSSASGDRNLGIGAAALSNVTGANNTALGHGAGTNVGAGTFNTFLGSGANLSSATQRHRATALGNNAKVDQDDALVLGDAASAATRVGIGTTTPGARLHVVGDDNDGITAALRVNSGAQTLLADGNEMDSNGTFYLQNNSTNYLSLVRGGGRVGIGIDVPVSRLANTTSNIIDSWGFGINAPSLTWSIATQGAVGAFFNADASPVGRNGLLVKIAATDAASSALDVSQGTDPVTSGSSLLRVQADGNVGIANSSPADRLDVHGIARLGNQGGAALRLTGAGSGSHVYQEFYPEGYANGRKAYFGFPGDGNHDVHLLNQYGDGATILGSQGSGSVHLITANQGRLSINGSGDVTVGDLAGTGTRVVVASAGGTLSTSSTASTALDDLLKLQKGTATVGPNASSAFKTFTITFPTAFATAPNVTCTARNEGSTNFNDTFAVTIRSVSTTQFVVNIQRVDNTTTGWGQNLLLSWIALP